MRNGFTLSMQRGLNFIENLIALGDLSGKIDETHDLHLVTYCMQESRRNSRHNHRHNAPSDLRPFDDDS